MSAAMAYRAPLPLYQEGLAFWEELLRESAEQAKAINGVVAAHGLDAEHGVQWKSGRGIMGITRKWYPSTDITVSLSFEHWGPVVRVLVTGYQHEDLRFYPEEQEVPIARDLDGCTVAVLGEGRSYSPREFAAYLMQHLKRCFPEIALPYTPTDCY